MDLGSSLNEMQPCLEMLENITTKELSVYKKLVLVETIPATGRGGP
jgi:hypothetical protein